MKRPFIHRATGLIALAFLASLAPVSAKKGGGGGGGKPGGGGGEDPPPPAPAPVAYELTWFPGVPGTYVPGTDQYTRIFDINSSGIAVGQHYDGAGTALPFWTTSDGVINPLDNLWVLPSGYETWQIEGNDLQINDAGLVCGIIEDPATGEEELFIADLEAGFLQPVGAVPGNAQRLHMNEHGDVAFMGAEQGATAWSTYLYVHSSGTPGTVGTIYNFAEDIPGLMPTGINNNLQVSLISNENPDGSGFLYHGSARLTFDPSGELATVEDLGIAQAYTDLVTLSWGGINNAGTVFGCFETTVSNKGKRRGSNMMAGFIASGAGSWTELDSSLPTGSSLWGSNQLQAAACVLSVNEAGQVVGGYDSIGHRSADLFLQDPVDGILNLNDLVTGSSADVDGFLAANDFRGVHITEPDPLTGYGIISGYDIITGDAFILTPVPVAP